MKIKRLIKQISAITLAVIMSAATIATDVSAASVNLINIAYAPVENLGELVPGNPSKLGEVTPDESEGSGDGETETPKGDDETTPGTPGDDDTNTPGTPGDDNTNTPGTPGDSDNPENGAPENPDNPGTPDTDPDADHEHTYVDGLCECGMHDETVDHIYVNGVCACGEYDPEHEHEFLDGVCICGMTEEEWLELQALENQDWFDASKLTVSSSVDIYFNDKLPERGGVSNLKLGPEHADLIDGTAIDFIDRIDFSTDGDHSMRSFYDWLIESTDNDGINDYLIEDRYFSADNLFVIPVTFPVDITGCSNQTEIDARFSSSCNEKFYVYTSYFQAITDAFNRDHPEVFWLNTGRFSINGSGHYANGILYADMNIAFIANNIRNADYPNESAIKAAIAQRDSIVDDYHNHVSGMSDYEKIRYFNMQLAKTNEYNTIIGNGGTITGWRFPWISITALVGNIGNRGPVCESYARAFKVLCDREGIPCVLEDGDAKSSLYGTPGAHMWNYVFLEDNWYAVDVTWDDPSGGRSGAVSGFECEKWLLLGSDTEVSTGLSFINSHPSDNRASSGGLCFTNGPELSHDSYLVNSSSSTMDQGKCGTNLNWKVTRKSSGDYVLNIYGTGDMDDYYSSFTSYGIVNTPWKSYKDSINEVVVSSGVTSISGVAFYSMSALRSISIADTVTSIGEYMCAGDGALTSVKLSKNITVIPEDAFSICNNLTSIEIPEGVTSIEERAFFHTGLTSISLPVSVASIGSEAFGNQSDDKPLAVAVIKNKNCSINNRYNAFQDTTTIYGYLGSTAESYAAGFGMPFVAIDGQSGTCGAALKWSLNENGTLFIEYTGENGAAAEMYDYTSSEAPWMPFKEFITAVEFDDYVSLVSTYAFKNCTNITTVILGEGITTIMPYAFSGCTNISNLYYTGSGEGLQKISIYNGNEKLLGSYRINVCRMKLDGSHNIVPMDDVAATCISVGYRGGYHCSNCGKIIVDPTELPMLGHDYGSLIAEIPATCKTAGTKSHYECNRCHEVFNSDKTITTRSALNIPKLASHVWGTPVVTVEAGCTTSGNKRTTCTSCGEYKDEMIMATGHNYGSLIAEVPSTCVTHGMKKHYECSGCGMLFDSRKNEVTADALELPILNTHTWEVLGTVTRPATCIQKGEMLYKCTVAGCSATKTEDIAIVSTNHTGLTRTENQTTSTCKVPGYTGDIYCSDCNALISSGSYIGLDGTNHTGSTELRNVVVATCHSTGYSGDTYCLDCNEIIFGGAGYITAIDPANHDGETSTRGTVIASCISTGYTGDLYCDSCNQIITRGSVTEIDPTNHKTPVLDEDTVVEANCKDDGYTGDYICPDCETVLTVGSVIPATGAHVLTDDTRVAAVAPSCLAAGNVEHWICSVCGDYFISAATPSGYEVTTAEGVVIPATGVINVSFDLNYPDEHKASQPVDPSDKVVTYGETYASESPLPVPAELSGYQFMGWALVGDDGRNVFIANDNVVTIPYDITLVAQWLSDDIASEVGEDLINEGLSEIPEGIWIHIYDGDLSYDGSAKKPEVHVYYGSTRLSDGTNGTSRDYTLAYRNNVSASESADSDELDTRKPYVTVSLRGMYSGKLTRNFQIAKQSISAATTTTPIVTGNNSYQNPAFTVTLAGRKLVVNRDYQMRVIGGTYAITDKHPGNNGTPDSVAMDTTPIDPGTYIYAIAGIGNYEDSIEAVFTITSAVPITKVSVGKLADRVYTGAPQMLSVDEIHNLRITYGLKNYYCGIKGEETILDDKGNPKYAFIIDNTVDEYGNCVGYRNNTNVGTATVILRANNTSLTPDMAGSTVFFGTRELAFKITGVNMSNTRVDSIPNKTYNGKAQEPAVTVKYAGNPLVKGSDYTVTYQNNVDSGTATVVITGKGRFTGQVTKKFQIKSRDISDENISINPTSIAGPHYYIASGVTLDAMKIVDDGITPSDASRKNLVMGRDYVVDYYNNRTTGTNVARFVVRGIGNYTGSMDEQTFSIEKQLLTSLNVSASDVAYKNKIGNYKTTLTIKDSNGKALVAGRDYDRNSIHYYYIDDTDIKRSTKADAPGVHITVPLGSKIEVGPTDIVPAGTIIRMEVDGTGNYANTTTYCTYRVVGRLITGTVTSASSKVYAGKPVKLTMDPISNKYDLTVKYGRTKLVYGTDYVIDEATYRNNTKTGYATVTIRGIGTYGGTKVVRYRIRTK